MQTMNKWLHFNPVKVFVVDDFIESLQTFVTEADVVLFLTSPCFEKQGYVEQVKTQLKINRLEIYSQITTNPDLEDLELLTEQYIDKKISKIIALGGGSVLDSAKVLSVTLVADIEKPLVSVLREKLLYSWKDNLSVIAIPTTAGTGAEVTPFATIWDNKFQQKYSVSGDAIFPHIALLDAKLTLSLSYEQTLYSGLDAVSHALESLWNKNRTLVSELYAIKSLQLALHALPLVCEESNNIDARVKMQQASFLAGFAISQTKTAIAHAISYPLTSYYSVPHGLACSFTLKNIIKIYLKQNSTSEFKEIMLSTTHMLDKFELKKHIEKFATDEQLKNLKDQMGTADRLNNFEGVIEDILLFL